MWINTNQFDSYCVGPNRNYEQSAGRFGCTGSIIHNEYATNYAPRTLVIRIDFKKRLPKWDPWCGTFSKNCPWTVRYKNSDLGQERNLETQNELDIPNKTWTRGG